MLDKFSIWLVRYSPQYRLIPMCKLNEERPEAIQQKSVEELMNMRRRTAFIEVNDKIESQKHFSSMSWRSLSTKARYKKSVIKSPKVIFYGSCQLHPNGLMINNKNNEMRSLKSKVNFRGTLRRLSSKPFCEYTFLTPSGGFIVSNATTSDAVTDLLQDIVQSQGNNVNLNDVNIIDQTLIESSSILVICHVGCNKCRIFRNKAPFPTAVNNANVLMNAIQKYRRNNQNLELMLTPINKFMNIQCWSKLSKVIIRRRLPSDEAVLNFRINKLKQRMESQETYIQELMNNGRRGDVVGHAKFKLHQLQQIYAQIDTNSNYIEYNDVEQNDDNDVEMTMIEDEVESSSTESTDFFGH